MIRRQLHEPLQRHFKNFTALLTSEVLNKATTLVIYGLVSRNLSVSEFGQLSLGLMLFYTFQVAATAGLPTIITRAIAQRRNRLDSYCINGMATAACSGMLSTIAMILLTILLQYQWQSSMVIFGLALGLIPHGMALVVESVFRGCERMHFVAISNVTANLVKVIGAVVLFQFDFGILAITMLLLATRWIAFIVNWICYATFVRERSSRIKLKFVRGIFKRSLTFLGIDLVIAVWATIDALILSKLATEVEVGLFSAACQLLQPLLLVYKSVVSAIFPSLCARAQSGTNNLLIASRRTITLLLVIGTPLIAALFCFPGMLLQLCYGESDIRSAAGLLKIVAGILVFQAFTSVLGHAFWASSQERTALRIVVVNLIASTVLGFALIAYFGVVGAAASVLAVGAIDTVQHILAAHLIFRQTILRAHMALPLIGGATVLLIAHLTHYSLLSFIAASCIYLLVVSMFLLWRFREHFTLQQGAQASP